MFLDSRFIRFVLTRYEKIAIVKSFVLGIRFCLNLFEFGQALELIGSRCVFVQLKLNADSNNVKVLHFL